MSSNWVKLEEKGRELASAQTIDSKWYGEVRDTAIDITRDLDDEYETLEKRGVEVQELESFKTSVWRLFNSALFRDVDGFRDYVYENLPRVDDYSKLVTGSKCSWLRDVLPKDRYSPRAAMNDATACYHKIKLVMQELSKNLKEEGKCRYGEDADPALVEACRLWNKVTNMLYDENMYIDDDYDRLAGYIFDGTMQLRVGSSPGHLTTINLEKGTLDYYDDDVPVIKNLSSMLYDKVGLTCEDNREGFSCTGVTKDNVSKVAAILSLATSMDIRIDDEYKECEEETFKHLKEEYESRVESEGEIALKKAEEVKYDPSKTLWDNLVDNNPAHLERGEKGLFGEYEYSGQGFSFICEDDDNCYITLYGAFISDQLEEKIREILDQVGCERQGDQCNKEQTVRGFVALDYLTENVSLDGPTYSDAGEICGEEGIYAEKVYESDRETLENTLRTLGINL